MFEANLGGRDHQRLAIVAEHLPAQNVEVVGWGGALGHLEVDVLTRQVVELSTRGVVCLRVHILEEALHVAGRVLGSRTIEAMGQEQDQAGLSQPLRLGAHEVLVNDQLCRVVEIAKLSFPEDEVLRALHRVAVLVPHRAQLAQICVEELHAASGILSHEV